MVGRETPRAAFRECTRKERPRPAQLAEAFPEALPERGTERGKSRTPRWFTINKGCGKGTGKGKGAIISATMDPEIGQGGMAPNATVEELTMNGASEASPQRKL